MKWYWKALILAVVFGSILGFVGIVVTFQYLKPYMEKAAEYDLSGLGDMPTTTTIYDRNNVVLGQIFTEDRIILGEKDIPENMIKALRGAEDKRFYRHPGIDIFGITRAALSNLRRRSKQGGSTITQQLAKNVIGDSRRTMDRKLVELFLAFRIEGHFSKDEIMALYLNRVYFGNGYFGLEAASNGYFGKPASKLTLSQAVFLAGMVRAPSAYSPYTNYDRILHRRNLILASMLDEGIITPAEYTDAVAEQIRVIPRRVRGITSHFTAFVIQELQEIMNFDDLESAPKGLSIYTTLDARMQHKAEKILEEQISDMQRRDARSKKDRIEFEGSVLAADQNGGVLIYCAGVDFRRNQFDHIRQSRRESNYLLSPFIFGTAFTRLGINPAYLLDGTFLSPQDMYQQDIPLTRTRSRFGNPLIIAQDALAQENRSIIRRVASNLGAEYFASWLRDAGIPVSRDDRKKFFNEVTSPTMYEILPLYSSLQNGGKLPSLHVIDRIENSAAQVIYEFKPPKSRQLLPPNDATQLGLMMGASTSAPDPASTTAPTSLPPFVTYGTFSNGNLDSWTFGYSSDYTIGVWLGSTNNQPLGDTAQAREKSLPLWKEIADLIHTDKKKLSPPHSDKGFVKVEIDRFDGKVDGFAYLSPAPDNTFVYLTETQLKNFNQGRNRASMIPQESILWFQTVLGERANSQIRPRSSVNAGRHPSAREIPSKPDYIVPGVRGDIISSDGIVLATDRKVQSLVLPWPPLDEARDEKTAVAWVRERIREAEKFFRRKSEVTDEDLKMLHRYRRYHPVTVFLELDEAEVSRFLSAKDDLKEFSLQGLPKRVYPQNAALSHSIGYIGRNQRRGTRKYQANEVLFDTYNGRAGIEQLFDEDLTGKSGQVIINTTPEGFTESHLLLQSPGVGNNVRLTVNMQMQNALEEALSKTKRSAGVIMDIKTGEIVALASFPTFNPNDFVPSVPAELWRELSANPDRPLVNKAFQEHYPPGSVFKVVTTMAAMKEGVFDPDYTYYAQGGYNAGGVYFTFKKEFGRYDFLTAITYSLNAYFMDMAARTGRDSYIKSAQALGVGKRTGIDLPNEIPGFMPTPEFVTKRHGRIMGAGDMANTSIGQGDVLSTPLQIAWLMSAVANRGTFYQPHIVRAVETTDGSIVRAFPPKEVGKFELHEVEWDSLHEGMIDAVKKGTAKRLNFKEIPVAAKTGTAQIGTKDRKRYAAWIAGFFPADRPKYSFCFLYIGDWDEQITGGRTAGELARDTLLKYYSVAGPITPDQEDIPEEFVEGMEELTDPTQLSPGEELMLRQNNPEYFETNAVPEEIIEPPAVSPDSEATPPSAPEAQPAPEQPPTGSTPPPVSPDQIEVISVPAPSAGQPPRRPEDEFHDITPPSLRR
ncbi:penicillin-binding transpeptidase domain-containing protein [Oscillatoria laete-virens NRMC-F 0139]|nr:penicillin-binding transpeptidase domain-containing protein [Oscillatoria laete-virens]MDL5054262.1 penicillin-binding transpeptidase domain-containing protein [Oscillatoria laete-virens NRMC-F 0139]